jgi:hypothetical protein
MGPSLQQSTEVAVGARQLAPFIPAVIAHFRRTAPVLAVDRRREPCGTRPRQVPKPKSGHDL